MEIQLQISDVFSEYKLYSDVSICGDTYYKLIWKNKQVNGIARKDMKNHIERIVKPMIAAMDTERKYGGDN